VLHGGTLHGQELRSLTSQLDCFRDSARTDAAKLVFHCMLTLRPEESLSSAAWSRVGRRLMLDLGYAASPFVLLLHRGEPQARLHIVGLAVDENGRADRRGHERRRFRRLLDAIERDEGLRPAVGSEPVGSGA